MNSDWEKQITEEGKRLRNESFPPELEESLRTIGNRRLHPRVRRGGLVAIGTALLLIASLTFMRGVVHRDHRIDLQMSNTRVSLITPSRLTPVRSPDEPICAAIYPPLSEGAVRVFFDEQDVTTVAERNESFVILDLPELTRPGSHLFRLEIMDRDGNIVGESSWLIYTL